MGRVGATLDRLRAAAGLMNRADQRRWAAASSLPELAELTVQWLQGGVTLQPGYSRTLDVDEPDAPGLTAALIALNRAGFLTRSSQCGYDGPAGGGLKGARAVQLAAVTGFADRDTADWLADVVAATRYDILVRSCSGADHGLPGVAVTSVDGQDVTAFGNQLGRRDIAGLFRGCGPAAIAAVVDSVQVTVYDPLPGANDLWPLLSDAAARRHDGSPPAR